MPHLIPNFVSDKEEYGNGESGSDCDDEDLDDELGLPYVLANIGLKEKRELFQFKKTHTDVSINIFESAFSKS